MNETTHTATFLGQFTFPNISAFLQNQPSRFQGALPNLISPRYMRTSIVGAYVNDDWRVRSNLMLNIGLRYEMSTVPSETNGKLSRILPINAATPTLGGP